MTVRVLLCPPLFFAERKKWGSFAINGVLYVFSLFWITAGLYGLIAGSKHAAEGAAGSAIGAVFFWLLCLAHVADARRRERAPARPRVSLRSRILESVLIVTVALAIAFGGLLRQAVMGMGSWAIEASRMTEALWEAEWIVEQARQYQHAVARNPGSMAELRKQLPEAQVEASDPWGRDWVVSPAFQDTRTPPHPGDLWVCSRGPAGERRCPPENLAAGASSSSASIGYSARFRGWQGWDERAWLKRLTDILSVVLILAPLPGYIAYRIIRRVRGRPAPPLRGVSGTIVVVIVVGIMAFIAIPMYASVGSRARHSKATSDIRAISAAIAQYREHTGSSPATLADLTVAATNSQGQTAGPLLETLPTPPCCGRSQYTYKRWADGRYFLKYPSAGGFSTVLERGP